MSAAVQPMPTRERTGGRDRTEYLELLYKLLETSSHLNWLTSDEVVMALMEFINASYKTDDPRRTEVFAKLMHELSDRVSEREQSQLDFNEESIDRPTLDFIDEIMRGDKEAA